MLLRRGVQSGKGGEGTNGKRRAEQLNPYSVVEPSSAIDNPLVTRPDKNSGIAANKGERERVGGKA